jgi:hypothetical protein
LFSAVTSNTSIHPGCFIRYKITGNELRNITDNDDIKGIRNDRMKKEKKWEKAEAKKL